MAIRHDLVVRDTVEKEVDRASAAQDRAKAVEQRAKKLESLRQTFNDATVNSDRHGAGYTLQDLLKDLFGLLETEYRKSFRNPKNMQEIDGHFYFLSFDYLVEARWRKDQRFPLSFPLAVATSQPQKRAGKISVRCRKQDTK